MNVPLHRSLILAAAAFLLAGGQALAQTKTVSKVPVEFSEGHETVGQDRGRPVILIAGALGVKPEVFRDAFSRVHPAGPDRGPTGDEARANKKVLMDALGKYGIDNDRLDTVSNYYRYVRSRGEIWPTKPAVANALVVDGAVIGYEIISGGSGYSSEPVVTVPGIKVSAAKVELSFSKEFDKNGAISSITVAK